MVPGPDFPTGGVLAEDRETVAESYATGRGSFRVRAKWEVEKLSHGQYQVVVKEIPYQVQKGRVVEKMADLLNAKKLPLLGDIRDESAEDIRLILEPRAQLLDRSRQIGVGPRSRPAAWYSSSSGNSSSNRNSSSSAERTKTARVSR